MVPNINWESWVSEDEPLKETFELKVKVKFKRTGTIKRIKEVEKIKHAIANKLNNIDYKDIIWGVGDENGN